MNPLTTPRRPFPLGLLDASGWNGSRVLSLMVLVLSALVSLVMTIEALRPWLDGGPLGLKSAGLLLVAVICLVVGYVIAWSIFNPARSLSLTGNIAFICVGIAWILMPLDIVPDALPVVGAADDLLVGVGCSVRGAIGLHRRAMVLRLLRAVGRLEDDPNALTSEIALQFGLDDARARTVAGQVAGAARTGAPRA